MSRARGCVLTPCMTCRPHCTPSRARFSSSHFYNTHFLFPSLVEGYKEVLCECCYDVPFALGEVDIAGYAAHDEISSSSNRIDARNVNAVQISSRCCVASNGLQHRTDLLRYPM
jgi:hypothetical protein